jgi:hypothetical protein
MVALLTNLLVSALLGLSSGRREKAYRSFQRGSQRGLWGVMDLENRYNLLIFDNLAEREGFDNKVQRTFNNMQGQR